jgi:hypothetical protein
LCISLAAGPVLAADAPDAKAAPQARKPAPPEAQIPFADRGGIYNWQPVDDRTLLVEGLDHRWFKATLMGSCFKLPFAERIGFEWNPDGSFDRFSAIQVGPQRCQLKSLVETAAPAKKPKNTKPAAE